MGKDAEGQAGRDLPWTFESKCLRFHQSSRQESGFGIGRERTCALVDIMLWLYFLCQGQTSSSPSLHCLTLQVEVQTKFCFTKSDRIL